MTRHHATTQLAAGQRYNLACATRYRHELLLLTMLLYIDEIKTNCFMVRSRMQEFTNVDDYVAAQPAALHAKLKQLRTLIKKAAPGAVEGISYGMPAFQYRGHPLVYFAAFKNHFGFYPQPKAISVFKDRLAGFELSKGTIRLPQNEPLPVQLLTDLVKFRVLDTEERLAQKAKNKKPARKA